MRSGDKKSYGLSREAIQAEAEAAPPRPGRLTYLLLASVLACASSAFST